MPRTWILTGSLDNLRATREHRFRVIGAKEGRRGMAQQIEPGDRIVSDRDAELLERRQRASVRSAA